MIVNLFLSGIWIIYIKPVMHFTNLKVILSFFLYIFWILVLLVYLAINNSFIFLADFLHLSHIFLYVTIKKPVFYLFTFFPSQIDIVFSLNRCIISLVHTI